MKSDERQTSERRSNAFRNIKRPWPALFRALVLTCACASAYHSPAHAQGGDRPSLVGVDTVIKATTAQTESFIGQLVATQRGTVASQLAGLVSKLNVQIGDSVASGDVIAEIDIDNVRARRQVAADQLDQATAALEATEAQLGLASQERERFQKLQDTASVSQSLYDDAVQNEIILSARLREAQAKRAAAVSSLRLAEIDLDHGQIRAPYSGYVVRKFTEIGSFLGVGHSVVELIGDESLEIEVDVRANRLAEIQAGAEVTAIIGGSARTAQKITARIRAILPKENPRTRTRTVRLTPLDIASIESLADGQSVDVLIPVAAAREMVSVHKDAVIRRGEKVIVYIVEDGAAQIRPVTLGMSIDNRFEVLNGLAPGEQTVIRGNERLRPQAKVKIIPSSGSNAGSGGAGAEKPAKPENAPQAKLTDNADNKAPTSTSEGVAANSATPGNGSEQQNQPTSSEANEEPATSALADRPPTPPADDTNSAETGATATQNTATGKPAKQ